MFEFAEVGSEGSVGVRPVTHVLEVCWASVVLVEVEMVDDGEASVPLVDAEMPEMVEISCVATWGLTLAMSLVIGQTLLASRPIETVVWVGLGQFVPPEAFLHE